MTRDTFKAKGTPPLAAALGDALRLVAKLAAHVRPTCSELWDEAQAFLATQQPAADLRSTHRVWRGDDWQPCYCEATGDHRIGSEQPAAAHEPCAAVAAIQFALTDPEGMTFLRLWNEGEFDTLRREWPDALRKIYDGADPLA